MAEFDFSQQALQGGAQYRDLTRQRRQEALSRALGSGVTAPQAPGLSPQETMVERRATLTLMLELRRWQQQAAALASQAGAVSRKDQRKNMSDLLKTLLGHAEAMAATNATIQIKQIGESYLRMGTIEDRITATGPLTAHDLEEKTSDKIFEALHGYIDGQGNVIRETGVEFVGAVSELLTNGTVDPKDIGALIQVMSLKSGIRVNQLEDVLKNPTRYGFYIAPVVTTAIINSFAAETQAKNAANAEQAGYRDEMTRLEDLMAANGVGAGIFGVLGTQIAGALIADMSGDSEAAMKTMVGVVGEMANGIEYGDGIPGTPGTEGTTSSTTTPSTPEGYTEDVEETTFDKLGDQLSDLDRGAPDLPLEAKRQEIMESDDFQRYMATRGITNPEIALKFYIREMRKGLRGERRDARAASMQRRDVTLDRAPDPSQTNFDYERAQLARDSALRAGIDPRTESLQSALPPGPAPDYSESTQPVPGPAATNTASDDDLYMDGRKADALRRSF